MNERSPIADRNIADADEDVFPFHPQWISPNSLLYTADGKIKKRPSGGGAAQIIEFTTGRIDEFNAGLDDWIGRTDGHRIPHRAVLRREHDTPDRYLLMVEFASYEQAMENSARRETGEFAAFLAGINDGALTFRNLDVLREEDL